MKTPVPPHQVCEAPGLFYDCEIRPEPAGIEWRSVPMKNKGGTYFLFDQGQDTGWYIQHCGHSTANYPYYIVSPETEMIVCRSGRGFSNLRSAKAAVLQYLYRKLPRDSYNDSP